MRGLADGILPTRTEGVSVGTTRVRLRAGISPTLPSSSHRLAGEDRDEPRETGRGRTMSELANSSRSWRRRASSSPSSRWRSSSWRTAHLDCDEGPLLTQINADTDESLSFSFSSSSLVLSFELSFELWLKLSITMMSGRPFRLGLERGVAVWPRAHRSVDEARTAL